jgi:predicted MFS family arabinose efflux permease
MIQVKFVPQKSKESILKSMGEGLHFIRQREGLSALVALAFLMTVFGFSLTGFLPVIVQTVFHGGPQTYQALLVCSGAGSIAGALLVASSEKLKAQGYLVLLTLIGLGAATAGFAVSRWLPLSCVLIFITGLTLMASASLMVSLVQLIVADQMRGRVMSVYNLAFRLGIPLGSLLLGKTIPMIGITRALGGSGFVLIAIALYSIIAMRGATMFRRSTVEVAGTVREP